MALSITVTKVSVSEPMDGMVNVTLNLTCEDGSDEIINRDFSEKKKEHMTVAQVRDRFLVDMQEEIDRYKREQELFTHTALDNAVTYLEATLEG